MISHTPSSHVSNFVYYLMGTVVLALVVMHVSAMRAEANSKQNSPKPETK